jgi:hypothetical protein
MIRTVMTSKAIMLIFILYKFEFYVRPKYVEKNALIASDPHICLLPTSSIWRNSHNVELHICT